MDVEKLLAEMSTEEKLGQLMQLNASFYKRDTGADITGPVSRVNIKGEDVKYAGSVLNLVGSSVMRAIQDEATAMQPHGIPLMFMQDVIHGYRTIYPIPLGLACSFDEELAEECTAMAAREAAANGVCVTFAPMVDLSRDARWGRCMESAGEDVLMNCRFGAAQVRGYHTGGILSCVKHFCGYGAAEAGRDYNAVELSERTLRQSYLPAYKAAIDAGADMIMPSYNTIGNLPSHATRHTLTDILRGEWGFEGTVISDYNAYREIIRHGVAPDEKHAAELAINAGGEMEMMSATTFLYAKELADEGRIDMARLDDAVRKVLKMKDRLGLFDDKYRGASEETEKIMLCQEHRAIARKAAEQSAVLLKNDGVLPFSKHTKKIAVIGPFADEHGIKGFWSCAGRDEDCVTVLDGVRALLPDAKITCERGCDRAFDRDDDYPAVIEGVKRAVKAAKKADAVLLCLGEYQDYSGEGNSRATLNLPFRQMLLAKSVISVNPNTAVVLFGGRPLDLTQLSGFAPAMLYMWQPGTEGGSAVADLVFGDAVPCGKLSMTFPRGVGQEPIYYAHQSTARPVPDPSVITKEPYISRYVDMPVSPLYPFGYGLSYTTFEYGTVTADKKYISSGESLDISVTVKNTGRYDAKETVQLYVRDKIGSVARPVRELKDFCKIGLSAGEEKTVRFTLTEQQLRFWTKDMKYESESGEFEVFVGGDSTTENKTSFILEK